MPKTLVDFIPALKEYVKRVGTPCDLRGELVLWDGLFLGEEFISSRGRCLKAPDLAEALRVTATPFCVEKKRSKVGPPYLEYFSSRDLAVLAAVGEDGVYLVENIDGSVSCLRKTDMNPDDFIRVVETLARWLEVFREKRPPHGRDVAKAL